MPLELGIWRVDADLRRIESSGLNLESRLEEILHQDISILSPNWMIIGRQVRTAYGKFIDLLCVDRDGNLIVIELKRNMTEREAVAQVLDYGSWVRTLNVEEIRHIFGEYREKYSPKEQTITIDEAFCKRFALEELPEDFNELHELVIVGATFDASTERIVDYLASDHDLRINAVFFRVFKDAEREYLLRVWLRDPTVPEGLENASGHQEKGEWNGEYYVSFGHGTRRNWDDAIKYGFVSGGGDPWYSRSLGMLEKDSRIWVRIPGKGYVGVGIVTEPAVRVGQFMVPGSNGRTIPVLEAPHNAVEFGRDADNVDLSEFVVRVKWLATLPVSLAIKEKGLFGNQNTAARPRAPKWEYTVRRLKERFGIN